MKKSLFFIYIGICFVSCSGLFVKSPDEIVKEKTMQLFGFIKNNQLDSIRVIYPDFSEEYMKILTDSIQITDVNKDENSNLINVKLTNYYSENHEERKSIKRNIILTYCQNDSNDYYVLKSVGLINKDDLPVEAKLTGYLKYKAQDSDYDIIKDLNVLDIIKTEKEEKKKSDLAKRYVKLELWYKTGDFKKTYYKIINSSNQVIEHVQFKAMFNTYNRTYTNSPSAKDIAPFTSKEAYFDDEELLRKEKFYLVYSPRLVSYEITNITFPYLTVNEFDYDGNEYTEYLKKVKADSKFKTGKDNKYVLKGRLGGSDDAVFSYDTKTKDGEIVYTVNGQQNKRKIKIESFDKKTNKMIVKEYYTNGEYVGDFDGVFTNDCYQGTFTNTKGNSIEFKFNK